MQFYLHSTKLKWLTYGFTLGKNSGLMGDLCLFNEHEHHPWLCLMKQM